MNKSDYVFIENEGFRVACETTPDVVWIADPQGEFDFLSDNWSQRTGANPEDSLGWGWTAHLHPDDAPRFLFEWRKCLKAGDIFEGEARFSDREKLVFRWHLSRALPVKKPSGVVKFWIGMFIDTEAQRQCLRALSEAEARFKSLAESSELLIATLGPDRGWQYCNQAWQDFLGRRAPKKNDRDFLDFIHGDDLDRWLEVWNPNFSKRRATHIELRLKRRDGVHRWVSLAALPRLSAENDFLGFTFSVRDIHESRTLANELRFFRDRAAVLWELCSDTLWEWNVDLNQIQVNERGARAFPDLAPDRALESWHALLHPEDRERVILNFHDAINHGELVWRDECRVRLNQDAYVPVVIEGRIRRGPDAKPFSVIAACRDLSAETNFRAERQRNDDEVNRVRSELSLVVEHLTNSFVRRSEKFFARVTDPVLIFDPRDASTLFLNEKARELFGPTPFFGRAIPNFAEELSRCRGGGCFEKNVSLPTASAEAEPFHFAMEEFPGYKGAPAVLCLMKPLRSTSPEGQNSVKSFETKVPLASPPTLKFQAIDSLRRFVKSPTLKLGGLPEKRPLMHVPKKKVLLVEDEVNLRQLLRMLLESEGYEVLNASNGQEALEVLRDPRNFPQIILLDILMPVMGGIEFRKIQLANPHWSEIPVLVLSGIGDLPLDGPEMDRVPILRKPGDLAKLPDALNDLLTSFAI